MGLMTHLTVTPHPVLLDGQRTFTGQLVAGESLYAFLQRNVQDLDGHEWHVLIGGREVPRHLWHAVKPKDGQVIEARAALGDNALYIIAYAVLIYFTAGTGATAGGALFGAGTAAAGIANAAIFIAGSMLINKMLGPKPPSSSSSSKDSVYSIGSARNTARPNEPFAMNFGEVRVTPDIISNYYSYYIGNDQYVAFVLQPGLNCQFVRELYLGDALLSSFDDVTTWYSGFPGMPQQDIPLFSNVDTIAGGDLEDTRAWVQRTTSPDVVGAQINIEYALGGTGTSGKNYQVSETVEVQGRAAGASVWDNLVVRTFTSSDQTVIRRATIPVDLDRGQYDLRVRIRGDGNYTGKNQQTNKFQWTTLGSIQADDTDYTGIPRIGVRMRATGQLQGNPDEIRTVAVTEPIPLWTGAGWQMATDRASGLGNPGAQLLQFARGYYMPLKGGGELLYFGLGLPDDMIDIPALQAFALHCTAMDFTYDYQVKDAKNNDEIGNTIALAGMGQITWASGKFSVVWAADDQPVKGVVNMATIKKSSFKVDYTLVAAADGIEYTYYDRDTWESKTLYVRAPGVETALNPAKVSGEGITSEAHAAILARYHLGQSLYQFKAIGYDTDLEHLTYRRMDKLQLSHDMTQWGYGGRLVSATETNGVVTLHLDEPVPAPANGNAWIGVRILGENVYRVLKVQAFAGTSRDIKLAEAWPSDAAIPGVDNPAHDNIWIYDFKQTPGYSVRVASVEPESDLKGARISVVPESAEFWNYVLTGEYIPPASGSLLQSKPIASNLAVSERHVVQGDTVFTELVATFDITGPFGYAQVMSDLDGNAELEQVAETSTRTARWRIPRADVYDIIVRPFNADDEPGVPVSIQYTTQGADALPNNFDVFDVVELAGGIRKYTWSYNESTIQPPNLAGAEIRFILGSFTAPVWDDMEPLGDTGFHTSAFEGTTPPAGQYTFAIRARNTNGALSSTILSIRRTLTKNVGEIFDDYDQAQNELNLAITKEIQDRLQADLDTANAAFADATNKANAALAAANAHADVIGAQVADIIGADTWVNNRTYPAGDLVKFEGNLFRALQDVPVGTPTTNGSYWQLLGQYSSLGEAVAGSISIGTQNTSDIAAEAAQLDAVQARMPAGTGQLATSASVSNEQQARVDADGALGDRIGAVEARMPTGTDKLANEARVVTEEQARANADSALGGRLNTIETRMPAGTDDLATAASVLSYDQASVSRDQALGQRIDTVQASIGGTGGNLAYNGDFANGTDGWTTSGAGATVGTNYNASWTLQGGDVLAYLLSPVGNAASTDFRQTGKINVQPGETYCITALTKSTNSDHRLFAYFYDASGASAGNSYDVTGNNNGSSSASGAANKIADLTQLSQFITIPAGAVSMQLAIRKFASINNTIISALFTTRIGAFKVVAGSTIVPQWTAGSAGPGLYSEATARQLLQATVDQNGAALALAQTQVAAIMSATPNLLYNPTNANDQVGWDFIGTSAAQYRPTTYEAFGNIGNFFCFGPMAAGTAYDVGFGLNQTYWAKATNGGGKQFTLSADVYNHANSGTANPQIGMRFFNASGVEISTANRPSATATVVGWSRISVTGTAPAGTAFVYVSMRQTGTGTGAWYAAWSKFKLEVGATPTPYSDETTGGTTASVTSIMKAGVDASYTLALQVNGYISGIRSNNTGTTSTFDVVADTFRIVAPSGGARYEYSANNVRVYDANGVLRVRMGVW